jgi:hypothetical protein
MTDKAHFHLSSNGIGTFSGLAGSLELSTCNYFPHKYQKNKGHVSHPRSDNELKLNIREETAATLMDMTGPY